MRILPHLMTTEEMNDFFAIVKIDEGEHQWTKEFEQLDVRPVDELADPGPRGRLDLTPAISAEGALVIIDSDLDDACGGALTVIGDDGDGVFDSDGTDVRDSERSRVDPVPRRARRWPPGPCVPATWPARWACVCCPESEAVQCGGRRRPSSEPLVRPIRGFGPSGATQDSTNIVQRKDEYPRDMTISSRQIDESSQQQGLIDRDIQSESRGVCQGHSHWPGSRSLFRRLRPRRRSFGWRQCRHNFVQADEHLRGHPHI